MGRVPAAGRGDRDRVEAQRVPVSLPAPQDLAALESGVREPASRGRVHRQDAERQRVPVLRELLQLVRRRVRVVQLRVQQRDARCNGFVRRRALLRLFQTIDRLRVALVHDVRVAAHAQVLRMVRAERDEEIGEQ